MKKRTSRVSRRIVSLLMSMVLTLTLVTPAAFATEVVDGSGTTIVEGDTNMADANPSEDVEGGDSKDEENTEDENDGEDDIALLDGGQEVTVGKPSVKWYTDAVATDPETKEFTVRTAEDMAGLAQLVNGEAKETAEDGTTKDIKATNFEGCEITLVKDINLSVVCGDEIGNWTPIGRSAVKTSDSRPFSGTFDGQGHTIRGLYINKAEGGQGLFGYVKSGGVVQNLIVTGTVTAENQSGVGGIVATNLGKVQNCGFYGAVTAGTYNAGGVVGSGSAANCWYYREDKDASALGVYGGYSGTNCYTNVNKTVYGTTICTEAQFKDGTVANLLSVYAYENGLPLWEAGNEKNPYPVINVELKYTALVKLAAGVNSSAVAKKVKINDDLTQILRNSGETLTLTAAGVTGEVYYTVKNPQGKDVKITENDLMQLPAVYTVKPDDVDEKGIITLYCGTRDELTANLAESGWYYNRTGTNYSINTREELHFLATLVNDKHIDFSGKTITLNADIDLSGIDWTPIGKDAEYPFKGTFNGYKKVISGLSVAGNYTNAGLFGVVDGGKIQNVTIKDGKVTSAADEANIGGIVGWLKSNTGKVDKCACIAEVSGSGQNAVIGGLVGRNDSKKTNVANGYCYGTENLKPVGKGEYSKYYYMATESTYG